MSAPTTRAPRVTPAHTELAHALLDTFRPRRDVFAERFDTAAQAAKLNAWCAQEGYSNRFEVGGYKPAGPRACRTPLTVAAVAEHVAGLRTIGFYPLHPDGTANSISLDFDNHRGTSTTARDPREDLDACIAVCLQRGLRFLANHSRGGKGYWLHLLPPPGTPAREGRAVMAGVVREAGLKHITDGGTFDAIFPKQGDLKSANASNPGNLFCVPCGGRWLRAHAPDLPGTHFVNTDPHDLAAQLRALREY